MISLETWLGKLSIQICWSCILRSSEEGILRPWRPSCNLGKHLQQGLDILEGLSMPLVRLLLLADSCNMFQRCGFIHVYMISHVRLFCFWILQPDTVWDTLESFGSRQHKQVPPMQFLFSSCSGKEEVKGRLGKLFLEACCIQISRAPIKSHSSIFQVHGFWWAEPSANSSQQSSLAKGGLANPGLLCNNLHIMLCCWHRQECLLTCFESAPGFCPTSNRSTSSIRDVFCLRWNQCHNVSRFYCLSLSRLGVLLAPLGHESEDDTVVLRAQLVALFVQLSHSAFSHPDEPCASARQLRSLQMSPDFSGSPFYPGGPPPSWAGIEVCLNMFNVWFRWPLERQKLSAEVMAISTTTRNPQIGSQKLIFQLWRWSLSQFKISQSSCGDSREADSWSTFKGTRDRIDLSRSLVEVW